MLRRRPRSTPFPTRRSSDLLDPAAEELAGHLVARAHREPAAVVVRGIDARVLDAEPGARRRQRARGERSEEHTSELQSLRHLVCRLLLEKKKNKITPTAKSS